MNQESYMLNVQKRLEAAQGYLMLEMDEDARESLDGLTAEDFSNPEDRAIWVALRLELAVRSTRWESGIRFARELRSLAPENPGSFIQGAYCLHELGRTDEAKVLLLEGPESLHEEPLYHYNLGCYHALLGDRVQALACLNQAFERDPQLRRTARKDPDLKGLKWC